MTVGEKIQFYRKKIGLSQEELGKQLLVSRQTVSLWEMDKTMPTVDNLIRLKEIFGTSIDDILSETEKQEVIQEEPREKYQFGFSDFELKEVFGILSAPIRKRMILFAVISGVVFLLYAVAVKSAVGTGIIFGAFLVGMSFHAKGYYTYKNAWKNSESRLLESQYSYEVFHTHLVIEVSKHGEMIRTIKVRFSDIERLQNIGKYFILQVAGECLIVKKEVVSENSFFYSHSQINQTDVEGKQPFDKWWMISIGLFVCSILSVWGALTGVSALSDMNKLFTENMWVFFLFTPIPVASVVIGFVLKRKGYKYKKNIVAGIIVTVLLCVFGSFTFIFSDMFSHTDEPIRQVEQSVGIDIPVHFQINTYDSTRGAQLLTGGYDTHYISDIYFEDDAVKGFEEQIRVTAGGYRILQVV